MMGKYLDWVSRATADGGENHQASRSRKRAKLPGPLHSQAGLGKGWLF
jgi:hypothetical protein